MKGPSIVVGNKLIWIILSHDRGYLLKYAIKRSNIGIRGRESLFWTPNIISTEGKWTKENISRNLKQEQYHALNQTIVWLMLLWSMKRSIC